MQYINVTRKGGLLNWAGAVCNHYNITIDSFLSSKRRFGLDCSGYCLLASGKIDLVIEPSLKNYDIQALIPIIEGSGGIITTWNNEKAYQGGNIIACSNKRLHSRVIKIINDNEHS